MLERKSDVRLRFSRTRVDIFLQMICLHVTNDLLHVTNDLSFNTDPLVLINDKICIRLIVIVRLDNNYKF